MPLVLTGEGHYALRDVKTLEVTKEFVGLGEKVTHCQTEEYRVDCLSSKYREKVLSQCQCCPWNLRTHYGCEAICILKIKFYVCDIIVLSVFL